MRDQPRASSLIVGASHIQDLRDCAPYPTLRTCRVRYFEHSRVRFDERRGLAIKRLSYPFLWAADPELMLRGNLLVRTAGCSGSATAAGP